jgi:predicted ester cyclase
MSTEQNKALLRRYFDEIINKRNFPILGELMAPGLAKDLVNDGVPPDGFNQSNFGIFYSFPDLQITIEDDFAEGDKVATRGYLAGTHKGDFEGLAPTGKQVKFAYIDLWRVENGKLVEFWGKIDHSGLMKQLGLVSKPAQGG